MSVPLAVPAVPPPPTRIQPAGRPLWGKNAEGLCVCVFIIFTTCPNDPPRFAAAPSFPSVLTESQIAPPPASSSSSPAVAKMKSLFSTLVVCHIRPHSCFHFTRTHKKKGMKADIVTKSFYFSVHHFHLTALTSRYLHSYSEDPEIEDHSMERMSYRFSKNALPTWAREKVHSPPMCFVCSQTLSLSLSLCVCVCRLEMRIQSQPFKQLYLLNQVCSLSSVR